MDLIFEFLYQVGSIEVSILICLVVMAVVTGGIIFLGIALDNKYLKRGGAVFSVLFTLWTLTTQGFAEATLLVAMLFFAVELGAFKGAIYARLYNERINQP